MSQNSILSHIQAVSSPKAAAGLVRAHAIEAMHLLPDPQSRQDYWQLCVDVANMLEVEKDSWRTLLVTWGFRLAEADDPSKACLGVKPLTWEEAMNDAALLGAL